MDINLQKKQMVGIGAAGLVCIGAYFLFMPLAGKSSAASQELRALRSELAGMRQLIETAEDHAVKGRLLTRREVSQAIDAISKVGTELNINFLSTKPQNIIQPEGAQYLVLPIRMQIQSGYKDFGLFLGRLGTLEHSVVTIQSFQASQDGSDPSAIRVELVVNIHLKEGEDE